MNIRLSDAALLALLVPAGCASSQGEQVKDARMEQVDAQAHAQQKAYTERADQQSKQLDKSYDTAEHQINASTAPAKDANEKLTDVSEQRAQYEVQARERINKLYTRIVAANEKLQILGPRATTALRTELQTTIEEYNVLKHDVLGLHEVPAGAWDATTQNIDARTSKLDDRVSNLTKSIDDV